MKRLCLLFLSITVLALSACDNDVETQCIEVKVVTQVCGNAILQVLSGYQGLNLGTWTDHSGTIYQNTFSTFMDPCSEDFPENLEAPFFITFADEREKTDCIVCLALPADMPETYIDISFVAPCNTNLLD